MDDSRVVIKDMGISCMILTKIKYPKDKKKKIKIGKWNDKNRYCDVLDD